MIRFFIGFFFYTPTTRTSYVSFHTINRTTVLPFSSDNSSCSITLSEEFMLRKRFKLLRLGNTQMYVVNRRELRVLVSPFGKSTFKREKNISDRQQGRWKLLCLVGSFWKSTDEDASADLVLIATQIAFLYFTLYIRFLHGFVERLETNDKPRRRPPT